MVIDIGTLLLYLQRQTYSKTHLDSLKNAQGSRNVRWELVTCGKCLSRGE